MAARGNQNADSTERVGRCGEVKHATDLLQMTCTLQSSPILRRYGAGWSTLDEMICYSKSAVPPGPARSANTRRAPIASSAQSSSCRCSGVIERGSVGSKWGSGMSREVGKAIGAPWKGGRCPQRPSLCDRWVAWQG